MTTRILYIPLFAWLLLERSDGYTTGETLVAGCFWLAMVLAFEWGGSFLLRRPVHEILEGWHVEKGYMWPYVLLTYLFSPLLVGLVLHPGPERAITRAPRPELECAPRPHVRLVP